MVNFRVGDRVEVVNSGSSILKSGDIGTITLIESNVAKVHVNGKRNNVNWVSFEGLKLIPTDNQRIEALEKEVAAMRVVIEEYFKIPMEVE